MQLGFGPVEQPLHHLYGGAITAHISPRLRDASTARPLEDTQEQFVNQAESLTFDIMAVPDADIEKSMQMYLRDLTKIGQYVIVLKNITPVTLKSQYSCYAIGCDHETTYQNVHKSARFYVGILRLQNVTTDLLVYYLGHDVKVFEEAVESLDVKDMGLFAPEKVE